MFDAPDIEKHSSEAKYTDSVTKYVLIYICILLLAGLQFLIARQNISTTGMVRRMLLIAIAEAGLAIMFFMHLWAEKAGLSPVHRADYGFRPAYHAEFLD